MEIKDQVDGLVKTVEDFKSLNDKRLAEIEKKGYASAELEAKVNKANDEITALQAKLKAVETVVSRPGADAPKEDKAAEYRGLVDKFFRKGEGKLSDVELKTLSAGSDPDGGYLIMPEQKPGMVEKQRESSPMRAVASVQGISQDSLEVFYDLDEAGSGWVSETGARTATSTPQFKKRVILAHELYANIPATQKILDDAMINVEQWLINKANEKFARDEATAFFSGNGVGKPRGILTYSSGTTGFEDIQQVVSGSAALISDSNGQINGLMDLYYSLKSNYKANASWMMNRLTVGEVRKLKDANKQYIWAPGIVAGAPDTLLGKPIYEANDMEAVGANALPIAFGDFRQGYQIVDRFGVRVLRDPYTSKPNVLFYMTKRVGGDVVDFEAIKLLKCST